MNASFKRTSFCSPSTYSFSRKRQSQSDTLILSEGASHILEHYGCSLPSMVRVVLNKVDDTRSVSFRLDRNGWAWLVWKRHLYIWRYVVDVKKPTIPCREFVLPPSELFHHAKLVTVVTTSSPLPACIAVSPEGHITYWPNISNESATVSINADLPGQECDSLTSVWPIGCILATTSATVLLIKPALGTRPSLSCISLNCGSRGWLGGLSKRMSYLMPMGTSTIETKRASVAVPIGRDDSHQATRNSTNIYVLAGTHFQIWSLNQDGQQCTCDLNLDDIIRKQFHRTIWEEKYDLRGIQIWLLDIRADDVKKIRILGACLNQSEPNELLNYGIFTFDGTSSRMRETIQLKLVKYRCPKGDGEEEGLYNWKLLSTPSFSFMISHERIIIIGEDSLMDSISSERVGGPFIGGGLSNDNMPLIFTPSLALFLLRANQTLDNNMVGLHETMGDVRVPDHLAMSMTQRNLLDLTLSEDNVNRYKSAFLHFCAKRIDDCSEVLNSLFPSQLSSLTPEDPLDVWTVALCEKLIDDAPITDPRWASTLGKSEMGDPLGLKSKLLIKNFLADKKKGIEIFFSFLRVTGVWQRLSGIVVKDATQATGSALYNAYEKIGFAMVLHFLQTDERYRKVVDPGIKSIVAIRQHARPHSILSFNDIFFKDISMVHQILSALVLIEEGILEGGDDKKIYETVSLTTEVILVLFAELRQLTDREFTLIRQAFLLPLLESGSSYEVSPWYIQSHTYEALTKQVRLLVTTSQLTEHREEQLDLFRQLEQLLDIILDALKTEVESLRGSERYVQKLSEFEGKRGTLLGNLVILDSTGAISLAEKYLDFNILVSVTYQEKDIERLHDFFEKYYDLGFPIFTFEWFLKQKRDGELLQFFSRSKYSPLLTEFLKDYPSISWHHSTLNNDFYSASRTLSSIAKCEETSLEDQKFLFCLSKLALLATGTEHPTEDMETFTQINKHLEIIQFQNDIPEEALEINGMERGNMRVLTPSQLIDLYTSPLIQPNVVNFWKAAQIIHFLPEVAHEKRLLIVARAILSEPWSDWEIDHPLDVILPSVLYKFLRLVIANGNNLKDYFHLEVLSKLDMLDGVFTQGNARYLLSVCQEHLQSEDTQ